MTNNLWDKDREDLRNLLKDLRKNHANCTQMQLSQQLNKPQSYVSKYESGERKLDYIEIRDICKILGISMQRFSQLYEDILTADSKRNLDHNK